MTPRRPALALVSTLGALGLAAGLSGCISVLPKSKPAQLYRFQAASEAPPRSGDTAGRVALVFPPVQVTRAAASDRILTSTGDETAYIAESRWVSPASVLLTESVERAFAAHAARTRLIGRGDLASAQGFLRLEATEFEARYAAAGAVPVVRVTVGAMLSHRSGAFAADHAFSVDVPATDNRVAAIVTAFDQAVEKVAADLIAWTDAHADEAAVEAPAPNAGAVAPLRPLRGTSRSTQSTTTSVETRPRP